MKQYDRIIINRLLDSYENSSLYTGSNKINVSIALHMTKKVFPEYFNENSGAYEEIHVSVEMLEKAGLARAVWKDGHKGHILDKVVLNTEKVATAYEYVGRTDKKSLTVAAVSVLENFNTPSNLEEPVTAAFAQHMIMLLKAEKSIKEYADISEPEKLEKLLRTVQEIEKNSGEMYLREFSISVLGDSKAVEGMKGTIAKIFRRFSGGRFQEETFEEILGEYGIYTMPNYMYFKGCGLFRVALEQEGANANIIDLGGLSQGIGLSGEDIENLSAIDLSMVKRVITIENLTSFFSFQEPDCLAIYLGGYHNRVRRRMLTIIHSALPSVPYMHFGDVDAGGFEIFFDLRRKTGIDFRPYNMDVTTLKSHAEFGRPLTSGDIRRLETLREKVSLDKEGYVTDGKVKIEIIGCIGEMLKRNIKIEQECVR